LHTLSQSVREKGEKRDSVRNMKCWVAVVGQFEYLSLLLEVVIVQEGLVFEVVDP